jgi:TDG/mug DNA glycosylase family protein
MEKGSMRIAGILRTVLDVLGKDLKVLFVGINPSLRSAEVGHNFARPGNRFYPALHAAGFTPRQLRPDEDGTLPAYGVGITNFVARPTRAADELSRDELRAGARHLDALVAALQPRLVAVLGLGAYQTAFARPKARMGRQPETIGGRPAWILPNPSGLNAHYKPADFARLYEEVRLEAERRPQHDEAPPAAQVGGDHELAVDEVPVEDGQDGATGR